MPIFSISFCLTSPVEWAIALGGVLIGRHIAHEAAMAIPIRIAEVPPMIFKESPMPWQTTARIGQAGIVKPEAEGETSGHHPDNAPVY